MVLNRAFKRKTTSEIAFEVIVYCLLTLILLVTLYPFLYVIFAAFSDPYEVVTNTGLLFWFKGFTVDTFVEVLHTNDIWIGFRNSVMYVLIGVTINMTLTILGGYTLSRKKLKFRNVIMLGIVFTMIFKGGLIPTYILVRQLGLTNTLWAVLLPSAINTMNLVIMRTGFAGVPEELEESARIDGAGDFMILTRILLPVTMSTVLTLVMYYAVSRWNAWFSAFIYLRNRQLMPLQIFLREILIQEKTSTIKDGGNASEVWRDQTFKYCTIVISTLPIMLVFPFIQKYFGKGVMVGAIKG
ncbi:MAG: carbohydrate ABC transporter permease [Clostridia bacterium]|nr:carbohydrate ABC transporter permease [Clostridia bacterium]